MKTKQSSDPSTRATSSGRGPSLGMGSQGKGTPQGVALSGAQRSRRETKWPRALPGGTHWEGVWVFGDYRNYFQNRVTLQLIAKGRQLARKLSTDLTVLVLGSQIHQYAMEYTAHGADVVMVMDHPSLKNYQVETYVRVVSKLVQNFKPEIFLAGATA